MNRSVSSRRARFVLDVTPARDGRMGSPKVIVACRNGRTSRAPVGRIRSVPMMPTGTIGTDTITLLGVNGVGQNIITQADFLL